jgi:hypothetical protein
LGLSGYGCSPDAIRTTEQYVQHALVVIAAAVRLGHRRLMDDFLPDGSPMGESGKGSS